jgi:hypothetical protein
VTGEPSERFPPLEAAGLEGGDDAVAGGDPQRGTAREGKQRPPAVRYLGFRTTADGREYLLQVTGRLEPRLFVLLITHQAFASREARFQDAPDLCFAKLQRDLLADPALLPGPRLVLTDQEILEYRQARDRPAPGRKRNRPAN